MSKLIAGNWKENPKTEKQALFLFSSIVRSAKRKGVEIAVMPPFIYLEEIARHYRKMSPAGRRNFSIGAQDVFWEEGGAFTSQVGPKMLRSLGTKYVIIGHSERRKYAGDTDAVVNRKVALALKDGLAVILCVGESIQVRKKGTAAAKAFVRGQLLKGLKGIPSKARVTVAYEPLWAIGSGLNDKPEDAGGMAAFIKSLLKSKKRMKVRVLYGGSVKPANAADYVQLKEIDGALIGGASLKAEAFKKIINSI